MEKFIVASGPVIIDDGRLLVSKDEKDDFYKLPGGIVKEGENLEDACLRKAKQELNADIEIIRPLFPKILYENPQTKEKMVIVLINYLAKLKNKTEIKAIEPVKDFKWISVDKIMEENVSPNVKALFAREEIK